MLNNTEKLICDIGVVLVTYNRLEKLKKALASYEAQTTSPSYLMVVDNASGDGTAEFLDAWEKEPATFSKIVLHLPENVGGSGGFYVGQERALTLGANWVMLADDDAYPEVDYLEGMQQYIDGHDMSTISALSGKIDEHGEVETNHRGHLRRFGLIRFRDFMTKEELKKECVELDMISYVGIVINRDKLKKAGLVNAAYFIWNDDIEHSMRLRKEGKLLCLPQYGIIHDCDAEHMTLSWKSYYGWRNQIDMYRRHFPIRFLLGTTLLFCKTCLLPLKGNRWTEMGLRFAAIWNGARGKLGLHQKYRPGWKP